MRVLENSAGSKIRIRIRVRKIVGTLQGGFLLLSRFQKINLLVCLQDEGIGRSRGGGWD